MTEKILLIYKTIFNFLLKIKNHLKYLIINSIYLLIPIRIQNLTLDFKIIGNFILCDLKYNLIFKKKFKYKKVEHKNYIKNKIISNDWFSSNIVHLQYLIENEKLKEKVIEILEIGSYEGNSTLYFLNNLNVKTIACVDTFEGSDEHDKKKFSHVYQNFLNNTHEYKNKISIQKYPSRIFFKKTKKVKFDLIYIDGSHRYEDILHDATEAYKLLRNNGLIIFDDFLWKYYDDRNKNENPKTAIKEFLKNNIKNLKIVYCSYQIILKKISS